MPSTNPLKAFETRGFTPGGRLLAWAIAATDSAYFAIAFNSYIFLSKLQIYSISSLKLGKSSVETEALVMVKLNFARVEIQWPIKQGIRLLDRGRYLKP